MATPKLCAYLAFVFVGDQNINFFHWIPFLNPHIHGVRPATQMASDHVLGAKETANTKDGAPR
jgi:hypothetical protein